MRPVPPFTERHEALRAEMRAFVETELRPLERAARDARLGPIGGGTTDEIMGKTLGL